MDVKGRVWKFGNDVDTDAVYPARFMNTSVIKEIGSHCFQDYDPDFVRKIEPGGIIVAGKNFGCGSSREHAPTSVKAAGISCVIASSFARIFYRNAVNMGLPVLECPEAAEEAEAGDVIRVDLDKGEICNETKGTCYEFAAFPAFIQEIFHRGGLLNLVTGKDLDF